MGRTKTLSGHAKRIQPKTSTNQQTTPTKAAPSPSALFEKAQALVEQCDYDLAIKFLRRIIELDQLHVASRELLGVVLLEKGELDEAKEMFETLIPPSSIAPTQGLPSAHLHLAQLCDDDPRLALKHYQAAVDGLYIQLKGKEQPIIGLEIPDESILRQTIAKALVGMTEIWLTDLCMEPEAEQNCENLLSMAIQADERNADVLQSLASVRMSQQKPEEAKQYLERAWSLWKDLPSDDPLVPSIPVRLATSRLFLELSLFKEALTVLTGIISTDDQEVEAWYLEGWCFLLMSEDAKEKGIKVEDLSWQELAQDARDCLETCLSLFRSQDHPDKALYEHAQELIEQLIALGIRMPQDIEDSGDWEDVEDSGDEDVEMS